MKQIPGGVTAAKGFEAAGVEAGIKYKNRMDMARVYSQVPCKAAGTFTTNVVKAAAVKWDYQVVHESEYAQAVIINAGVANACTGAEGYGYCKETAKAAAEALNIAEDSVLVASTGVIGMQLPMERLAAGVKALAPELSGTIEAGTEAAKAIMTTDTVKKEVAVSLEIGGKTVTIGGMCKGSGMIHPNMCTMLGFITTDADISKVLDLLYLKTDLEDVIDYQAILLSENEPARMSLYNILSEHLAFYRDFLQKKNSVAPTNEEMCQELLTIKKKYAKPRKTEIVDLV